METYALGYSSLELCFVISDMLHFNTRRRSSAGDVHCNSYYGGVGNVLVFEEGSFKLGGSYL